MFSTAPPAFSSSDKAREASPISTVPFARDSSPAPDPVNSGATVTFGYFSMNASAIAFASFSIEVLPASVILPLKSALAVVSVVASAAWLVVFASALLSVAVFPPHPITPTATTAADNIAIIFLILFFISHVLFSSSFCRLDTANQFFYSLDYRCYLKFLL